MSKRWEIKDKTSQVATDCALGLSINPIIATILAARGICSPEEVRQFLSPAFSSMHDPYLLLGMHNAVARLLAARKKKETVCIYGDYDVDGITGTVLLVSFLRVVGYNCIYFVPNRFDDGYGLNNEAIDRIIAMGANLIVSVDCGITAVAEADYCHKQGADLIIVDHHAPHDKIPLASAVINPLQLGCKYPFKALAGVGVAFNLLVALRSALREQGVFNQSGVPDLREWLDLVALGTIADVVPLTCQNRMYVYHGLKQLNNCSKPGIIALKKVAGTTGTVNCGQVGFRLAPRLNAAGRMESAVPGVDLLLSIDPDECGLIARELDVANAERQVIERSIFDEAVEMIEKSGDYPACRSIVLASGSWHQGVIGIVASRLVERYHRPTILIALGQEDGLAKGSGRSIPGLHLLETLVPCCDHLERFGGHRYAAGIGLKVENVQLFCKAFEAEAKRVLNDDDLVPRLAIDAEVRPEEITRELALELKQLEPFGAGNPEPVLLMRGMTVVDQRIVGGDHLRLRLSKGGITFSAIAFRMAGRSTEGPLDIAFFPELNDWNGNSSLQLRIKDLRSAE
ncbi:MAG TPA: single-stranded-DNA-specific exonuclease RecJ [Desulfuromonadaceae bacterium]